MKCFIGHFFLNVFVTFLKDISQILLEQIYSPKGATLNIYQHNINIFLVWLQYKFYFYH